MLLVCKGKLQYTLFIKVVGGKEIYRKKKQRLKLKCIHHILWSRVTKQIFGFVEAAWTNHSQCNKRQLDICASFIYMMK